MSLLLLDANLWSYLGEETDANTLAAAWSAAGHEAVTNPQMLTETLRTSYVAKRTRIVDMMCSRHWRKLWSSCQGHHDPEDPGDRGGRRFTDPARTPAGPGGDAVAPRVPRPP